jgi:hypothetical protein
LRLPIGFASVAVLAARCVAPGHETSTKIANFGCTKRIQTALSLSA